MRTIKGFRGEAFYYYAFVISLKNKNICDKILKKRKGGYPDEQYTSCGGRLCYNKKSY